MVVVVLTAGGALLALRAYNKMPEIDRETVIFSIQQSTAVLAALCAAIFAVITALKTGRPPGMFSSSAPASPVGSASTPTFSGRPVIPAASTP